MQDAKFKVHTERFTVLWRCLICPQKGHRGQPNWGIAANSTGDLVRVSVLLVVARLMDSAVVFKQNFSLLFRVDMIRER